MYSLEHLELDLALSFWNIRMAMGPDATPATLDLVSMALCNIEQDMMPYSFERALRKLAAAVVVNAMHPCECIACRLLLRRTHHLAEFLKTRGDGINLTAHRYA